MALFAISKNLANNILHSAKPAVAKNLCDPSLTTFTRILCASISGKAYRQNVVKKPPYPYMEKNYNMFISWIDRTTERFDENTKVIVVEGPVAAGKTAFAKELAEELGMYHIPEVNMNLRYINSYGYDMRQLDPLLPPSVRSFDEKNFCMDPFHENAAAFHFWMYRLRVSIYIDALAHILSTGQGVVLERCPWSDFVFVEAMVKSKYMSNTAREIYYEVRENTYDILMRPHLVIYLDVPVKTVMENIKKRNLPHEVKGKALTEKYLTDMEEVYKREYLPKIEEHADVLMYDWTRGGDVEAVVEDLERMDLDNYTKHDKKQKDWRKEKEQEWADTRMEYADNKEELMERFNVPLFHAPELNVSGQDMEVFVRVWNDAPGNRFEPGFDASEGDTGLLFKTKARKYVRY